MASEHGQNVGELRALDADRYLSTLYAPAGRRSALGALYLFNAEIASIRDRAREPMAGEIRLQWWRDAIAAAGQGAVTGNPSADALIATIRAYSLPLTAFDDYLEARLFDLYDDPMPDRTALEAYCGHTASVLIQLASLILEPEAAPEFADAAGHAGCAQAIGGLLRLLPRHRARGQCYVPADLLNAAGTTPEAFLAGEDEAAARRAIAAMGALGREHEAKFRGLLRDLPPSLRPAYLPAALAGAYLGRIESGKADPLAEGVDVAAIRRFWIMMRHAMRGWGA